MTRKTSTKYRLQMTLDHQSISEKFQRIKKIEYERLCQANVTKNSVWSVNEAAKAFESKRNRYSNVLPFDKNRVILRSATNDYINASHIYLRPSSTRYIATQGPTKDTLGHFWQMVLQESGDLKKDVVILMLTPLKEGNITKCSKYWCDTPGEFTVFKKDQFDLGSDLRLLCTESTNDHGGIKGLRYTQLGLRKHGDISDTVVHHLYFDKWTDFGTPENGKIIQKLSELTRSINKDGTPLITHCSAGVGRTGTFIALDHLLHNLGDLTQDKESDAIFETVQLLREQRMMMVQSDSQYMFLYDALNSHLK